ncbi:YqzK family protein [Caldalkalibacillus mannanilyticus]|uniref:YqzK family protein n=1 Tax=Caldalkalibacillus mannanilyticus TaxID=1418 RepID=UPI000468306F|nr:YqzK family protein [Caldalkalibacillus mannanilyticus]
MNTQLHKFIDVCKLLVIFITLTLLFYGMIIWVVEKIEPHHRYNQPKGKAVKVFQMDSLPTLNSAKDYRDRLLFFYWYGE